MFSSSKPEKVAAHLRWTHVKLGKGQKVKGWICGPTIGVHTHWDDGSKPCRKKQTEGKLTCKYCQAEMKMRWTGYTPLFDEHGRKIVVTIGADVHEQVSQIPFATAVTVSKGQSVVAPVLVSINEWTTIVPHFLTDNSRPQDIREWLLHMWGDVDLTAYWATADQAVKAVPEMPLAERREAGKEELEKCAALIKDRLKVWNKEDTVKAESTPVVDRLPSDKTVSANGQHRKRK